MAILFIGLIIGGISLGLMLANGGQWVRDAYVANNWSFYPTLNSYFWTTLSFTIVGGLIVAAGLVVQLVAWVGALVNTYHLVDKLWFVVLLVGGLVGISFIPVGWAVMIAYIVAQPQMTTHERSLPVTPATLPYVPQSLEPVEQPRPLVPVR
jgi:hypothetical protein